MKYICNVSDLYRRNAAGGNLCFRYQKPDGSWAEKSTGTKKRGEARDKRREFQSQMEGGQVPTDMAGWTLERAKKWWVDDRRPPAIEESTWIAEGYRLKAFVRILGANRRLRDIQNSTIDEFVRQRRDEEVGEWSIKKELLLWRAILDKANLFERLRRHWPKIKTKESDIGQARTREELQHLVQVAMRNADWAETFFTQVLAANTGMRGGEIKKLKVGLIDLERRELLVSRKLSKSNGRGFNIPLNLDALEAASRLLDRYHQICKDGGIVPSPDHYLLPFNRSRVNHGPLKGMKGFDPTRHQTTWDTSWSSLTREAGLVGFRFHDLRHSFITHLVERGIPVDRIQTMVGQLSKRMVLHYTHISTKALHRDVAVLDAEPLLPALAPITVAPQSVN